MDAFLDLMQRRLGIEPRKIMLADSICSDDLNIIEYPERAYESLGPFKLGGLDGFPFAGLTGMRAFAHHGPFTLLLLRPRQSDWREVLQQLWRAAAGKTV